MGVAMPELAGLRASFASSMRQRSCPIALRMPACDFSGANRFSPPSVGSSTLIDSRSAYRPAAASSSGDASGMVLRWMYPAKAWSSRRLRATSTSCSIV